MGSAFRNVTSSSTVEQEERRDVLAVGGGLGVLRVASSEAEEVRAHEVSPLVL
jgi:hypothetical protein